MSTKNRTIRRRIFEIIELAAPGDRLSALYDRAMMALILLSMVPLFFKQGGALFTVIDRATAGAFILDYASHAKSDTLGRPPWGHFLRRPPLRTSARN